MQLFTGLSKRLKNLTKNVMYDALEMVIKTDARRVQENIMWSR